jgi:hypothetical protein
MSREYPAMNGANPFVDESGGHRIQRKIGIPKQTRNNPLSHNTSEVLVDIEASMRFGNKFRVAVGAENVFDTVIASRTRDAMTIRCCRPMP